MRRCKILQDCPHLGGIRGEHHVDATFSKSMRCHTMFCCLACVLDMALDTYSVLKLLRGANRRWSDRIYTLSIERIAIID